MQKKYFISFLAVIVILLAGSRGEAFVPQTPHLLHLMVKKIRIPSGLTIVQTRKIAAVYEAAQLIGAGEGAESPDNRGIVMDAEPVPMMSMEERLTYKFPDRLRSEINNGAVNRFYVLSGTGFVKVMDGWITGLHQIPGEYYTDPLLYRDHAIFARVLASRGVNTDKVTLQRLDGDICWFIGDPAYGGETMPGLWIGKDSFLPKRYLVKQSGRTIDVRYGNWQRVSQTWYPKEARIFVDGELFVENIVDRMALASGLSASPFDIKGILGKYPRKPVAPESLDNGIKRLDTEIDTFNKLYD